MEIDWERAAKYNDTRGNPNYLNRHKFAQLVSLAQTQLGSEGYSLAIDGEFGPETERHLANRFGVKAPLPGSFDVTADYKFPRQYSNGVPWLERSYDDITAIVVHQTACRMGEDPQRYARGLTAHYAVTKRGREIRVHDEKYAAPHANSFNPKSIGIEFDGLYAGIKGNLKTVWNSPATPERDLPDTPPPEQIHAGRNLIRRLVKQFPSIKHILAHRQSSLDRQNDPGEEIYKDVVLFMLHELNLSDGEGDGPNPIGYGGYFIPREWNMDKKARY